MELIYNPTPPSVDAGDQVQAQCDSAGRLIVAPGAQLPTSLGRKTASASTSIVSAGLTPTAIAASQTDSVPGGGAGAANDYLSHIVIQPATTGAGTVVVKDGSTALFTFTTGTLSDLKPITVPFGAFCATAWKITTGANVSVLAVGNFT